MNQIYKKDKFIIVPFFKKNRQNEFMVINISKKDKQGFKKSHTHLKSFKMAKYIIELSINRKINQNLSPYLLRSLIRVSEDQEFIENIEELLATKKQKGKKLEYRNKK